MCELRIQSALRVAKDVGEILQPSIDFVDLVSPELAVLIDIVNICAQALRDLSNLGNNLLAMSEDDEDVLVDLFVVLRVDNGVRDFGLVHVEVATQRSPKDALKRTHPLARDDPSYKANVHHAEALLVASPADPLACSTSRSRGASSEESMDALISSVCPRARSKKPPASLSTHRHSVSSVSRFFSVS